MKERIKYLIKVSTKIFLNILYSAFVVSLVISGIVFGIMTLIPDEASKPCYLGYYAHCSFTPYSTIIILAIILIGIFLLIKLIKRFRRKTVNFLEKNPKIKVLIRNKTK